MKIYHSVIPLLNLHLYSTCSLTNHRLSSEGDVHLWAHASGWPWRSTRHTHPLAVLAPESTPATPLLHDALRTLGVDVAGLGARVHPNGHSLVNQVATLAKRAPQWQVRRRHALKIFYRNMCNNYIIYIPEYSRHLPIMLLYNEPLVLTSGNMKLISLNYLFYVNNHNFH